jgi:hypothetical protein
MWYGAWKKRNDWHVNEWKKEHSVVIENSSDKIFKDLPALWKKAHDMAVPVMVGIDFAKFVLSFKEGGLVVDMDTSPVVPFSKWNVPKECEVLFGIEHVDESKKKARFRDSRRQSTDVVRGYQIETWAMYTRKPGNKHMKGIIEAIATHILGRQDVDLTSVQEMAGSGVVTDYVAYLFESNGMDYIETIDKMRAEKRKHVHVDGLCLWDVPFFRGAYVQHHFTSLWREPN